MSSPQKVRMLAPKLVIFDCDGVLVDSEAIACSILARHVTEQGWSMTPEQSRQHFQGLSMSRCVELIEQRLGRALPSDFLTQFEQETFACFRKELQPVIGIESVLQYLQETSQNICVASSGSHEKMAVTLGKTNLKRYFGEHVFSAAQVAHGKPAPDLFLFAAQQFSVAPSDCWVVEDSLPGVQAGLAAGMQVIGYCPSVGDPGLLASSVHCIAEMSELTQLIRESAIGG